MKCPQCGYSDEPLKDSKTGVEIKPGDVYDVMPNGDLLLVVKPAPEPAPEPSFHGDHVE
jgi:hypothetical protein